MEYSRLPDIKLGALRFSVALHVDDTADAPWESECGHGQVRHISRCTYTGRMVKDPGERLLSFNGRDGLAYNFQGAIETAKRDGWGLAPDALAKLAASLGRDPTRGEIVAAAVESDFQRLAAYCADQWHYVGVMVTLQDVDGCDIDAAAVPEAGDSLWGIESDAGAYHVDVARELAAEIAARVGRRKILKHGARAYRIRK